MIKEEQLKQEAEEKAKKRTKGFKCQDNCEKSYVMGALDFAEPREKRIAELEKEIERITVAYNNCVRDNYYKTLDLEKENAELKKQQFSLRNERNTFLAQNEQYEKDLIDFNEQLTKATEIIKKLYAVYYDPCVTESDLKYRDELFAEIKQFLKEYK